jgi:hypothetical protein
VSEQETVEVRLLGLPLGAYRLAQQHHDELVREFTLIALDDEVESVSRRLVALVEEFRDRYAAFTTPGRQEILDAAERGEDALDITFRVPRGAGEASGRLLELLEEADDFCRQGDLLTMASPPEAAEFRRWYLQQFIDQCAGRSPTAWASRPSALPAQ